jgi:hypothetical protein
MTPQEPPLLVHEPDERESNPVVLAIAALFMPVVAGWRVLVAAGRGLRVLGSLAARWAAWLMRWLGRGAVAIGRGIVVVIEWIGQGLRAAGRLVGPVLRRFAIGVWTLLAPVVHAIGRTLSVLGHAIVRGVEWAARFVGEAMGAAGAVVGRMWRALYGPELLHGIGRLLVAAGRGVEWAVVQLCRGIGRVAVAGWRALLVVGRGIAWTARYAGRVLRAAGVGVGRVWRAVYGPELVQVAGGLFAAAASAVDQFLRELWRGVTLPFRWLRRVLRPFSVAMGDLKRRSAVVLRRQWRALRGSS